jgi:type II secretory ATPase GspE/PulE/Tfp pilus assembly ATPase PilB-like protein
MQHVAHRKSDEVAQRKIKMICATCGSDNVRADAYAYWNFEKQEWELEATFEKGAVCERCEEECTIERVEVT